MKMYQFQDSIGPPLTPPMHSNPLAFEVKSCDESALRRKNLHVKIKMLRDKPDWSSMSPVDSKFLIWYQLIKTPAISLQFSTFGPRCSYFIIQIKYLYITGRKLQYNPTCEEAISYSEKERFEKSHVFNAKGWPRYSFHWPLQVLARPSLPSIIDVYAGRRSFPQNFSGGDDFAWLHDRRWRMAKYSLVCKSLKLRRRTPYSVRCFVYIIHQYGHLSWNQYSWFDTVFVENMCCVAFPFARGICCFMTMMMMMIFCIPSISIK